MSDVHNKKTRSYNMSRIRSKDTKPEILARKYLFSKGFRYRLHDRKLPGKPDIVLSKYKTVLFIHGCFWPGPEKCKYFVTPKTRTQWWIEKIARNKQVDKRNVRLLKALGWRVLTVYECKLRPAKRDKTLVQLVASLNK